MEEIMADIAAGVEIVKEVVNIGDRIYNLYEDALGRKHERKSQEMKDKIRMINDEVDAVENISKKIPSVLDTVENAKKATVDFVVNFSPALTKKIKEHLGKDHGSKVKQGGFAECSITNYADKACIFDEINDRFIFLLADNVTSCRFVKEKFRTSKMKTYYYYEIEFTDGETNYNSYIRVSKKYRECLEKYVSITFE